MTAIRAYVKTRLLASCFRIPMTPLRIAKRIAQIRYSFALEWPVSAHTVQMKQSETLSSGRNDRGFLDLTNDGEFVLDCEVGDQYPHDLASIVRTEKMLCVDE